MRRRERAVGLGGAIVAVVLVLAVVTAVRSWGGTDDARIEIRDRATGRLQAQALLPAGWSEAVWADDTSLLVATCNPLAWFRIDAGTGRTLARLPYGGTGTGDGEAGMVPRWPVNTRERSALTIATPAPPEGGVTWAVGSDEFVWQIATERLVSSAGWSVPAPKSPGKNIMFLVTGTQVVIVWNETTEGCPASG